MRVALDARKIDDYGIGTYVRNMIEAASRLHPDWDFTLVGPTGSELLDGRSNVEFVPCRGRGYGPGDVAALSAAARSVAADVFHCPHYVTPVGLDIPLVVTIHDCIHLRFPDYLPRPLGVLPRFLSQGYARFLMRRVPRVAERIIAVSHSTRDDVCDLLGAEAAPIDVIPNGVSTFWSEMTSTTAAASPSILWVGNPKPHKGLDVLLRAFARLADDDPALELTLAGSDSLASRIAGHPHGDRIVTHGRVTDRELRDLYREASVFCMPSRHEGFGLPVLEAMAAGTPVVAAAGGALPEVLGDAGTLVPVGDVKTLAAALRQILDDPELAERHRGTGRARAGRLTWGRCALATCRSYLDAAGSL